VRKETATAWVGFTAESVATTATAAAAAAAHALADDELGGLELTGDVPVGALLEHARSNGLALLGGEPLEQFHDPAACARRVLDPLQLVAREGDCLADPDSASGMGLHTASTKALGQGVASDREQPARGCRSIGPIAMRCAQGGCEHLSGQIGGDLRIPGAPREVTHHRGLVAVVERCKRVRPRTGRRQQFAVADLTGVHRWLNPADGIL
jgi:hypothetical protein